MRSLVLAPLLVVVALTATTGTAAASTSVSAAQGAAVSNAPVPDAAPDPGGVGIRLMDAPAEAASDPRARVYIVDHLKPGAVIQRRVEVSNTSQTPMHVSLYAAAAGINAGSFTGAEGRT